MAQDIKFLVTFHNTKAFHIDREMNDRQSSQIMFWQKVHTNLW